jgi:hypothetical protein
MSDGWHEAGRAHGCTLSSWNRVRATILANNQATNQGRCVTQLPGVCTGQATQVHHVYGRSVTGDDPRYLQPVCKACNLKLGDPRRNNPMPKIRSRW